MVPAIMFGAAGALQYVPCQCTTPWYASIFLIRPIRLGLDTPPAHEQMNDVMQQYLAVPLIFNGIGLLLGAMLLIAGLAMLDRKPLGARLIVYWAWAKLAFIVIGTLIGILFMYKHYTLALQFNRTTYSPGEVFLDAILMPFGIIWYSMLPFVVLVHRAITRPQLRRGRTAE